MRESVSVRVAAKTTAGSLAAASGVKKKQQGK
jgi:hypothetical protein